ncbi:TPA: DNA transposition protein, partial [Citrobacter koseri]|nr:DNA transposition protein [Citrobacter koseri]HDZ7990350.1 DNA transposition protein [Citrobacter koseri]
MATVNISDIRATLRSFVDAGKVTFAQVARETGLSSGTI